jgi:molybdate transport system ATP-binding protein
MLQAHFIKELPEFTISADFSADEEILVLSGPSGSGKTTILDCLAGIQKPDQGIIYLNGKTLYSSSTGINIHPSQRHMGYIFQDYALFQHRKVKDNIRYGWNPQNNSGKSLSPEDVAALLKIDHLLESYPDQLSGGEKQRVALARGLLSKPSLLLLDEPLSALDKHLRHELRSELEHIHRTWPLPFILVTHCDKEARLGKVVVTGTKTLSDKGKVIIAFRRNDEKAQETENILSTAKVHQPQCCRNIVLRK